VYDSLARDPRSPDSFIVREPARAEWIELPLAPQLESWMAKDHPDSQRLRAFVDDVLPRVRPFIQDGQSAFELDVQLKSPIPLTRGGRDMDNYLFPIMARLDALRDRVVSVFGQKGRGETSRLRAGPVYDAPPPGAGWQFAGTQASGFAGSVAWRDAVSANLAPVSQAVPPGPLELQIAFRGMRSSWHQDWKPTIDGLGAILGLEPDGRGHADDSRVTRLALHRMRDDSLGTNTLIGIWWRPAGGLP
jgi:hypothetical protein